VVGGGFAWWWDGVGVLYMVWWGGGVWGVCNKVVLKGGGVMMVMVGFSLQLTYICSMEYIYTLSINNIVFYVGRTKQPVARYMQHYNDPICCCWHILRYCSTVNRRCKMTLLYCIEDKQLADAIERELISRYKEDYYLMNRLTYKGYYDQPEHKYNRNDVNDHINMALPFVRDTQLNKHIFKQEIQSIKSQMLNYGQK
jgi:predicted GIY-YIG superfamily endonuclease